MHTQPRIRTTARLTPFGLLTRTLLVAAAALAEEAKPEASPKSAEEKPGPSPDTKAKPDEPKPEAPKTPDEPKAAPKASARAGSAFSAIAA